MQQHWLSGNASLNQPNRLDCGGARLSGNRSAARVGAFSCRCISIFLITTGSSMQAMILAVPPQTWHVSTSVSPKAPTFGENPLQALGPGHRRMTLNWRFLVLAIRCFGLVAFSPFCRRTSALKRTRPITAEKSPDPARSIARPATKPCTFITRRAFRPARNAGVALSGAGQQRKPEANWMRLCGNDPPAGKPPGRRSPQASYPTARKVWHPHAAEHRR